MTNKYFLNIEKTFSKIMLILTKESGETYNPRLEIEFLLLIDYKVMRFGN